jgi:hypothetical protein
MLTPGEYVLQKKVVDQTGVSDLDAFNDGLLSFADLLAKKKDGRGNGDVGYFNGSGLSSSLSRTSAIGAPKQASGFKQTMIDNSMHFGDIIIQNPKRETASDSLPSAIRKVSYAGGRRKPSPRLEKVDA